MFLLIFDIGIKVCWWEEGVERGSFNNRVTIFNDCYDFLDYGNYIMYFYEKY